MRDHHVRAIFVIEQTKLVGILTQQDGAIKVCLGGHDPQNLYGSTKGFCSHNHRT